MNLVLAHDYLIQMGGAERVVATMSGAYPEAPIYTSAVHRPWLSEEFEDADIHTTWMQRMPGIEKHFKKVFPLYPAAFRSLGTVEAEVAWISASTFAKNIRFAPTCKTVCYAHNTTRFLWQTEEYVDTEGRNPIANLAAKCLFPYLRRLDRAAAQRMDVMVANSENVRQRIQQHYRRDALVIHPPVRVHAFELVPDHDDFFLIASRLVAYKAIDLAVQACSALGKRLIVIGDGPDRKRLEGMAGPTVEFRGRVSEEALNAAFARCRAFIFPGDEDFGITPVEAMACGKPVIAYRKGGALETVADGLSGIFFDHPNAESLQGALETFASMTWEPGAIRAHSLKFSEEAFLEKTRKLLES